MSVRNHQTAKNPDTGIAAVLLAAGLSTRMNGKNKLLRPWRGRILLTYAADLLDKALAAGLVTDIIVVIGHEGNAVQALLQGRNMKFINNPRYAQGMASSLQCGINAAPPNSKAVLAMLGDMPAVQYGDITAVINAFARESYDATIPTHNAKRGNPVLLSANFFTRIAKLRHDTGARVLFDDARVCEVEAGAGVVFDVDTPDDFL